MHPRLIGLGLASAAIGWFGSHAAFAQTSAVPAPAATTPPPCSAPEHRQFDFWLGDWEVRDPTGKLAGRNEITSLHKGCVLSENYTTPKGYTGMSVNLYDADRKKWHQTWVDSDGNLLVIEGGLVDGKMVLAGETFSAEAANKAALQRITWTPLPDGRVRQFWETSNDGGKAWTVTFDGYYAKLK